MNEIDLLVEITKIIISTAAAVISGFALYKAFIEYKRQGVLKKSEILIQMRTRLRQDSEFSNICSLLESDSKKLLDVPLIEKDRFIGFFEELSLIKNSGLMNDQVAVYMFGYYAERCIDSKHFWLGLNKNEILWAAFIDFANDMKMAHKQFSYSKDTFKL